jgi:hypothetical protein
MRMRIEYYTDDSVTYHGAVDSTEENAVLDVNYPRVTVVITTEEETEEWQKFRGSLFPNNEIVLQDNYSNIDAEVNLEVEELNLMVDTADVEVTNSHGGTVDVALYHEEEAPFDYVKGNVVEVFSAEPNRIKLVMSVNESSNTQLDSVKK